MEAFRSILYLTYDGLSDPLGQSQILPYLLGLGRKGHRITIVSSEKKTDPEFSESIRKELDLAGIQWYYIKYTKSPPIVSTIYDAWRIRNICIALCKKQRFDIVHCRSYITSLIGHYLQKRFRKNFVFDTRGLYADERIDGGMWDQSKVIYKLIYRFFKNQEAHFLRDASYTICLTEAARDEIHSWKSIPGQPLPIQVIPCCVNTQLFSAENIDKDQQEQQRKELGLAREDLVISYVGAVGTWYMLEEMLDFFKRLLLQKPDARFLFITNENKLLIREKALEKKIPLDRILLCSSMHRDVPLLLSLSAISIFFIKPVYSKKASSPTKQGEIMSMGIPIICNSNIGDTDRSIRETGVGAIVRSFGEEDYDHIIHNLPKLLAIPKQKIRETAIHHFALELGIEKYHQVYQSLPVIS